MDVGNLQCYLDCCSKAFVGIAVVVNAVAENVDFVRVVAQVVARIHIS